MDRRLAERAGWMACAAGHPAGFAAAPLRRPPHQWARCAPSAGPGSNPFVHAAGFKANGVRESAGLVINMINRLEPQMGGRLIVYNGSITPW